MKIALSGAQGTGKTTILSDLKQDVRMRRIEEKLGKFEYIPEVVRTLKAASGMKINEHGTLETELLVLSTHIRNLLMYDNFVTDRCIIDNMIYTGLSEDFEGKEKYESNNVFLAAKLFHKYDLVFYIPSEFHPPEDGVRNLNEEFYNKSLKEFEDTYRVLLETYNNIVILKGNRQERVDIIIKSIEEKMNERT